MEAVLNSQFFDHALDFNKLDRTQFLPALEVEATRLREAIQKIAKNPEPPTFENTLLAVELAQEPFQMISTLFHNLFSSDVDEVLEKQVEAIGTLSTEIQNEILFNPDLFLRIQDIHQNQQSKLGPEEKRLTEIRYLEFVREGAKLDTDKQTQLKEISVELSKLFPQFSQNVLKQTNQFELWTDSLAELEGIPGSTLEAYKEEAIKKGGKAKFLITLQFPSYLPAMKFAKNRALREKLFRAKGALGLDSQFNNAPITQKIVKLRRDKAMLLGFADHAEFVLTERMAETKSRTESFILDLIEKAKPLAERDLASLKEIARRIDGLEEIKPWDVMYYAEKLKMETLDLDEDKLREFFPLPQVFKGLFEHARLLYGLNFKERTDLPLYHPEVRVFEVRDRDDNYIGLFYFDLFPRDSKKSGAWMTLFRSQGLSARGDIQRPHVVNVCNFSKPVGKDPALLTLDEVLTLFHEFGHGLHGLVSQVKYKSLAGTNVLWDFVELPSQIMENWVYTKEGLDLISGHFKTGEKIDGPTVEKIKKMNQFLAGYYCMTQMAYSWLDWKWHTEKGSDQMDPLEFEDRALQGVRLMDRVEGTSISMAFSHIFAGGYSASYYSYKWAEVLDADAFSVFEENGVFHTPTAKRFYDEILSKGNSEHPLTLYKRFRGAEPKPDALLKRMGL